MARKKTEIDQLVEMSEAKIFMTESELKRINEDSYASQLMKQEIEILNLKLQISKLKHEAETAKLNLDLLLKTQEFSAFKEKSVVFQQEISKRYNLTGQWGFHPDTGEIIIDE